MIFDTISRGRYELNEPIDSFTYRAWVYYFGIKAARTGGGANRIMFVNHRFGKGLAKKNGFSSLFCRFCSFLKKKKKRGGGGGGDVFDQANVSNESCRQRAAVFSDDPETIFDDPRHPQSSDG